MQVRFSRRTATGLGAALSILSVIVLLLTAPTRAQKKDDTNVGGAIFTTIFDGTKVNGNPYDAKEDVYLNGGPQNQKDPGLVPDGNYYFQVTDPSGAKK